MTNTIQFWMDVMLHNIVLKIDEQYNPILNCYAKNILPKRMTSTIQFLMDIILNNILPKMDEQYNPIFDGYYAK